MYYLI